MRMRSRTEVVSVIRHDVRPGHADDYEAWAKEVLPISQRFPGHQGVAIIRPPEGSGSTTYTIVLHFDTLEHLRGWLESDIRHQMLEKVDPHLTARGEVEIRPGLEFWLSPPGQKHARPWKQFLLVLAVIYPLSLVTSRIADPFFASVPALSPLPLRNLLTAAVVIALMTWIIMPRLTRRVAGWLYE